MFRAAAVLAAVALMTFAGCTKVDDTLGSNLVPDNQQMKVGYTTLGARTLAGKLDAAKYVETRLFQSDSLKASNISYGYMGSMLSDTFGLRTAGFLTQYLNVYKVKEGYFGYRPIFDSAQILITITSYGNDTLTPQKYNVYEIKSNKYLTEKPVAAGKTERDTVFYLNFDPVKEGVIGADDEPVFTFTFPDGETTGPATTAVTMNTTPATQNFIDRLMLQKVRAPPTKTTTRSTAPTVSSSGWRSSRVSTSFRPKTRRRRARATSTPRSSKVRVSWSMRATASRATRR